MSVLLVRRIAGFGDGGHDALHAHEARALDQHHGVSVEQAAKTLDQGLVPGEVLAAGAEVARRHGACLPERKQMVDALALGVAADFVMQLRAGRAKLAFYGERALRKLLGNALDPDIGTLTKESLPTLVLNPIATLDTGDRTAPIALADPAFDSASNGELLGETVTARTISVVHTPANDLLVRGVAPDPQPGRVDDHRWPPRDLPKPGSPEVKTP